MNRRRFLVTSLAGVVPVPLAVEAQQSQVHRIGILSTANPRSTSFYQAFEQRLRDLGYVDGQNIAFEYREAEGKLDRLPSLAAELVGLNVNVIVAATDPATRAARWGCRSYLVRGIECVLNNAVIGNL